MWTEETRMWDLALAVAANAAPTPAGLLDLATLIAKMLPGDEDAAATPMPH